MTEPTSVSLSSQGKWHPGVTAETAQRTWKGSVTNATQRNTLLTKATKDTSHSAKPKVLGKMQSLLQEDKKNKKTKNYKRD